MTSSSIDFANFNYAYYEFQQQYRLLCQELSDIEINSFSKIKNNPIKRVSALIMEYRVYIKNSDTKNKFFDDLNSLQKDIINDIEYNNLCHNSNLSISSKIELNRLYYIYFIRLFNIIGTFGDELSSTFMPTKRDRKKLINYQNTNTFFEQFSKYKTETCKKIAQFNIFDFRTYINSFIGFYFAYISYISIENRNLCEETFSVILNIYMHPKIARAIIEGYVNLSPGAKKDMQKLDLLISNSLTSIFAKMNNDYSDSRITPKIMEKIEFDHTLI